LYVRSARKHPASPAIVSVAHMRKAGYEEMQF
jgi:hypothetical protein